MNILVFLQNLFTSFTGNSITRTFYNTIHLGLITYGLIHLLISVVAWRESLNLRRQITTRTGSILNIFHIINVISILILLIITIEVLR